MPSAPPFRWLCVSLCIYVCVCMTLCTDVCVHVYLSCLSFSMCCPSVFLCVFLLIYLFMCPSFWFYLFVHLSGCMFFVLSLYLSVSVSAFSVYLSIYIYIYLFSALSCPVCVCDAYIDKNLLFAGQDTWTQNLSLSGRPSRSRCCLFSEPKSTKFYPQHSVTGPPAPQATLAWLLSPQTHVYPRTRTSLHLWLWGPFTLVHASGH